ncbi:insulinase family protein [bacterium]|nr:MAG: insulinase family protein [bacterium]
MLKKLAVMSTIALSAATGMAQSTNFEKVRELGGIEEYKLKTNGLTVLLKEDHSAPVVTVMITYNVGSRNEVTGTTGSTHLLEHLMFKGTTNFNKAKGNDITDVLQNLGAQMNATTWLDRTNYYENLPSEHMDLAVEIEADRMKNLLLRDEDRKPEMTVVRNEFERGENSPFSALSKAITQSAIVAHPYHHSTIGWRSDIENVSIESLREFYETFYWPDNATLSIIGDFKKAEAFASIENHFGAITKSTNPIPQVYTEEPAQEGQRRVMVKRSGQLGVVGMSFRSPQGTHEDAYALTILSDILSSGKSSRLYKRIVDEGLGTNAFSSYYMLKDPYLFSVYSFLAPGSKHEDVEAKIFEEIEEIKANGVSQEEVTRAINQNLASDAFQRDGAFSIASNLNEWIAMGDWTYYVTFSENLKKVTPADVQRVAKTYLNEDQSTVGYFIPTKGASGMGRGGRASYMDEFDVQQFEKPGISFYNNPAINGEESAASVAPKTNIAKTVKFKKVNGIQVYTKEMGVNDVVTIRGSFPAGDAFSPSENSMVADITAGLLDKGTAKLDKFKIAETLENLGANLSFYTDGYLLNFSGKMLKKDVPVVVELLADQLRNPVFSSEELEKYKKQRIGSLQRTLENTNAMASITYAQTVYPSDHPNYVKSIEEQIKEVEAITVDDVKKFHAAHYGPKNMIFVATGDIDQKAIEKSLSSAFKGWKGGVSIPKSGSTPKVNETKNVDFNMEDKTSVTLYLGAPTGLSYNDKERVALYVGQYILGGNFSARLMSIVRDKEGLTYGINSFLAGDDFADGSWGISGTFSPKLLAQGETSTMRELRRFYNDGVSAEELANKKSTLTGLFKVALSTTGGMAGTIHSYISKGRDIKYLDEYVDKINALTLDEVNAAIKKYMNPDKIVMVKAGTLPKE